MKYKSYPKYKDSGVEWLGEIPEHWEVVRLKNIVQVNPESLPETIDPDYLLQYIDISNVDEVSGINQPQEMSFESAPSRARRVVRDGDTILSTVRTYLKAVAFFEAPSKNLIVSTGFAVLRPKSRIHAEYLYVLVRCPEFVEKVVAFSLGVAYPAISPSVLASLPVWIPPNREEQKAIASFLKRETAKIDAQVAKKERLIELLQEKRTALITRAVTKGLDGIPGTKDLAATWTEGRLGRFIKLQRGFDITGASEVNEGIPVYSSGGLSGYTEIAMATGPGVLVGRKGTLGTVHYSPTDYWPHDTTLWVKEMRGSYPRFVYYFLISMHLDSFDVGSANPTLNRNHVHPTHVKWPDNQTQKLIATFLDDKINKLDAIIAKTREAIEHLKKYRTALISAAVTGKIDVREEVE
jgi:type I restriction enzyme S subunit